SARRVVVGCKTVRRHIVEYPIANSQFTKRRQCRRLLQLAVNAPVTSSLVRNAGKRKLLYEVLGKADAKEGTCIDESADRRLFAVDGDLCDRSSVAEINQQRLFFWMGERLWVNKC